MRILVISDTHIPTAKAKLPDIIEEEARASDCCLHCGDLVTYSVYETLSQWTKTYAVYGNMGDEAVRNKLPEKQILKFEEITLGLAHGGGHPKKILDYVKKEFIQEAGNIDIFTFGHSHSPFNEEIDGKIYFNPGSPTDTIFAPYRSYGILQITGKKITRRIIKIG